MTQHLYGRSRNKELPVNGEETPGTVGKKGVEWTSFGIQDIYR